MNKTKKQIFCKCKSCPPTTLLLEYLNAKVAPIDCGRVSRHLEECEFCHAELQFLRAHAPGEETVKLPEMPFQLRQLAEILLGNKQLEFKTLRRMFGASESISPQKAPLSV